MGASRSTTVVLAFLMAADSIPLRKALNAVKRKHHDAAPNPGFLHQLMEYEV
jgi:protein-tyrosine phosphatase